MSDGASIQETAQTVQSILYLAIFGALGYAAYKIYKLLNGGGGGNGGAGPAPTSAADPAATGYSPIIDPFVRTGKTASEMVKALTGQKFDTAGTWEETASGTGEMKRLYKGNIIPSAPKMNVPKPVESAWNLSTSDPQQWTSGDNAVESAWNVATPDQKEVQGVWNRHTPDVGSVL